MRKFIQALPDVLPDALLVAGAAAVSYGAGLIHAAAGFIVGGALLILGGLAAARNAKKVDV